MVRAGSIAASLAAVSALLCVPSVYGFAPCRAPNGRAAAAATKLAPLNAFNNPFAKRDAAPAVVEPAEPLEPTPGPLGTKNYVAGAVWAALIVWAFLVAPGELNSAADNEMITLLTTQPTPRPEGMNELWFGVWNSFAVVPLAIAALEAPVGRGQRLPAAPFLWGSAALGYFALGPYFAARTEREEPVLREDLGFASRNVFESKIFAVLLSALALSIPFSSGIIGCDFGSVISGYVDLASSSRFVAVASTDIVIMSALAAVLVSEDAGRRGWGDRAPALLAATALLPVIGPCLYLVARPSLEE